ncbi:hypothetical protein SARC_06016 [Sphaeroforma arctica JP610]|uniref:MIR domain-containing protein n=1 Tax=Sphaeroforma arctica JP610 TaxID=667725 RepID=A0A0L0FXW8_9EUKA|nr:hypothetical protein SARC_06016 [Sphaeroforma arctica JP610]KNC81662.1 hypothetical protein SARC_06016 [Sphaeroforma arctica JP610]|eukprot:XP_014155564.1 hypothetical protein SARC_06016 [Sphaeroforma arctica JP610]
MQREHCWSVKCDEKSLSLLRKAAKREAQTNNEELQSKLGQPIHYGDQAYLMHVRSGRYLTHNRNPSAFNRLQKSVSLMEEFGEDSIFTIHSRHKFRNITDVIYCKDEITLLTREGLYVGESKDMWANRVDMLEVRSMRSATHWKVGVDVRGTTLA